MDLRALDAGELAFGYRAPYELALGVVQSPTRLAASISGLARVGTRRGEIASTRRSGAVGCPPSSLPRRRIC